MNNTAYRLQKPHGAAMQYIKKQENENKYEWKV